VNAVSVSLALTAFVPVNSRQNCGGNADILSLNPHLKVPSEGRGQRFESSWVRQFSAIFEKAVPEALALRFVLRREVAATFPRRSCNVAQGIDTRSAIDAKRRGPKGESPVGLPMRPSSGGVNA
jgi:hypothetical protein